VISPSTADGLLNVTDSIVTTDIGSAVNKIQDQGLSDMECRKGVKAVNGAKTLVDTFTKMDQSGKKNCESEAINRGTVVNHAEAADGTSCKKGVSPSALSAHSEMRLKIQMQELKSKDWDIIKHAKKAGVPCMEDIAAAYVKLQFGHLFLTYS
jgi:hypothetical protein